MRVARRELAPGYSISPVVNGGWQLSRGHGREPIAAAAAIDALLRLAEAGLTTFDCADIYTGVEELYGAFLRRWRERTGDRTLEEIQIHTKCVPDLDDLPVLRRRDVERIVDRSLARLGVERLDLVQLHWWDYEIPGYVEAAGWLSEMRRHGKIRFLGATNFDVPHLAEILAAGVELVSHQVQYSLLDRRPERAMVSFCAERGLRLLCYGSLAGGLLSERYHGPDAPEGEPSNRSLVKYRLIVDEAGGWDACYRLQRTLAAVAARHRVSLGNVAVRWVLDRPQVAAAIVGARSAAHLEDNLRTLELELEEEDEQLLEAASRRLRPLPGDTFGLERMRGGRHARIMKTGLNRAG